MNKLEINTEEHKYLLNGKPIDYATEINIKITANSLPEVKITTMCELEAALKECNLTKRHGAEEEKNINEKIDNLILHLCESAESMLDQPNSFNETVPAQTVSALAKLLNARRNLDSNAFAQKLYSEISKEMDSQYF